MVLKGCVYFYHLRTIHISSTSLTGKHLFDQSSPWEEHMDAYPSLDCKDASDGVAYSLGWRVYLQHLGKAGCGGSPTGVNVTMNELTLIHGF